jgi:hypothetical protein
MKSWQSQGAVLHRPIHAAPRAAIADAPAPDSRDAVYRLFLLGIGLMALAKAAEFAIFGNVDLSYDPWSLLGLVVAQGFYDSSAVAV